LHYYLQAFGISISELDLDLQTILLYSLPPFKIWFGTYWFWIIGAFSLAWLLIFISRRIPRKWKDTIGAAFNYLSNLPSLIRITAFLISLLVLVMVCAFAIRVAALQNADGKWASEGTQIDVLAKEADGERRTEAHSNYRACSDRRALDLIISDKEAYYILCISSVEPKSAIVFEFRRSTGLASARLIQKDP
jgi:hypothetical protein